MPFTTQLRIYSSSTHNGYVVSDALPGTITKMTFNAGNKVDNIVIYGSNDGSVWTQVGEVAVTSTSYNDYDFNFTGSYTRFKLDVKGANQIRIAKMSVTYTTSGEGGGETPEPETPVLTLPDVSVETGNTIELNSQINISAPAEGNTVSYSINNGEEVALTEATNITAGKAGKMTLVIKSTCGEETNQKTYTYYVKPTKPTISATAESFNLGKSLDVEISATEGTIHYTLDGNDPTEENTPYEDAFKITETTTVKAIAVVDGVASDVAAATYTAIDPNAKTATLSFADKAQRTSFSTAQQVWEQNGITFTNNKASSTTNVADFNVSLR